MGELLLGIDLGAGSLKATLVRPDGQVLGEGSAPVATSTPRPGWAEQDPRDWWVALCRAVPGVLAAAGVGPDAVRVVGISAGAHIGVLCGGDGEVLRPAILWSDQRSAAEAADLRDRADERIIGLTLNRANPTWLLPQLQWIRTHDTAAFAATRRLYLAKDWLRHRLTGSFATDWSDVVGALMGDVRTSSWSPELCALVGWDPATLPPVHRPTDIVGEVTAAAAAECGLRQATHELVRDAAGTGCTLVRWQIGGTGA